MGIHIPILGMVKDDRHRTRALVTPEAGAGHPAESAAVCAGGPGAGGGSPLRHRLSPRAQSSCDLRLDGIPGIGTCGKGVAEALRASRPSRRRSVSWRRCRPGRRPCGIRPFHEKNT
ncbi:MAG: hypothetical protein ACLUIX_06920 [Oscillospiraceae bacterium]